MKIKTKKQFTLPQLIEWAMENDIKVRVFESNPNFDGVTYKLGFNKAGDLYFDEALSPTLLFTIEVEEELTEDTVIPELVELYEDTLISSERSKEILVNENISIRKAKDDDECPSRAFYIINDDLTLTLIWRDGKLVE